MINYGLDIWGDNNFFIDEKGQVCINHKSKPSIKDIVTQIYTINQCKGPIFLRFPHLVKKQIEKLFVCFNKAREEIDYKGNFSAVFPLKVNHNRELLNAIVKYGQPYGYGLEAGSKAELLLALAYNNNNFPITINGYKDEDLIDIAFIASAAGHSVTVTIEGLNELNSFIKIASKRPQCVPNIGIRIKLHSAGSGIWAKSGSIDAKFGLTSMELLEAISILKENELIQKFTMIHFHIGSQIPEINPVKKALREAGNIYAELRKMGATNLKAINLGGGLAVEYSQHKSSLQREYGLREYANDVTFLIKEIANQKQEIEPDIFVESGRYISASHGILVAPVLELFSQEYTENKLHLKDKNPPLINELCELLKIMNEKNALEFFHDSIDHFESLLTLFDLGYIDLQDRANTEILVHLIIKKAIKILGSDSVLGSYNKTQERYLVNFSMFQNLPDLWALGQNFPIMPLTNLNEKPTRSATIWDITCDSDGEIGFDKNNPLFLHEIDLKNKDYLLGFFLLGAYQEVLGMKHNLFTHPTEATIEIDDDGYKIQNQIKADSVLDIFEDLNYDSNQAIQKITQKISNSNCIDENSKKLLILDIEKYLNKNNYLKSLL